MYIAVAQIKCKESRYECSGLLIHIGSESLLARSKINISF